MSEGQPKELAPEKGLPDQRGPDRNHQREGAA